MTTRIHQLSVPSYLYQLIQEVEDKSGYPVSLQEEATIGYDMETRFARPGKPVHEIAISPTYGDYALHFLASGSFKIVRLWSLPPEERYVPASEVGRGLPTLDERELRSKLIGYPEDQFADLSMFLFQGLGRQVIGESWTSELVVGALQHGLLLGLQVPLVYEVSAVGYGSAEQPARPDDVRLETVPLRRLLPQELGPCVVSF